MFERCECAGRLAVHSRNAGNYEKSMVMTVTVVGWSETVVFDGRHVERSWNARGTLVERSWNAYENIGNAIFGFFQERNRIAFSFKEANVAFPMFS